MPVVESIIEPTFGCVADHSGTSKTEGTFKIERISSAVFHNLEEPSPQSLSVVYVESQHQAFISGLERWAVEGSPSENRQEAKDRILEAYCNDGEILNLSGLMLESIPHEMGHLKHLKKLNLSDNQLTTLPASFGELTNLQFLVISRTNLTTLPESIGNLSNLKALCIEDSQLKALPESIGNLSKLTILDLHGNQLTTLPESIRQLESLLEVNLYHS